MRHEDHLTPYRPGCGAYLEFAGVPVDPPRRTLQVTTMTPRLPPENTVARRRPHLGTRPSPCPDRPPTISPYRLPVLVRTTNTTTPMAKARMAHADGDLEANEPPPIKVRRGNFDPWKLGATDNRGT